MISAKHRHQGFGKLLVWQALGQLSLKQLQAETDREAVQFYLKLGFQAQSLGEIYPGIERFCCRYSIR